jgi:beta-N-acetylhexosaminidase
MPIIKRFGWLPLWLAGLVLVFAAANKNDPYLIALRGPGNIALAVGSVVAAAALVRRGIWRRGVTGKLLILLWCLPSLAMLSVQASFEWRKRAVLQTEAAPAHVLGQHFIVGYSSFPEVATLSEKGLIAGIYITKHNITGSSADTLKAEIAALQDKRRAVGLPPLIVAADQEGGIVSHLAPPAIDACECRSGYSIREGGSIRARSWPGTGGAWRQSQSGTGAGFAAGDEPQSVRFQYPDRVSRDFR